MIGVYVEAKGMTNPLKSDLPQGTLDLLILKVVALGPNHGYAIAQRIQQISRDVLQVQQGSLYPALHRMENRGLLEAEWKETETGREAKFYRLTAKGRKQLKDRNRELGQLTGAVGAHSRQRDRGFRMTAEDRMNRLDPKERELDAELRFDFDQRIAEKIRAGMDEAGARRAARLEFGGMEQVKEECRERAHVALARVDGP